MAQSKGVTIITRPRIINELMEKIFPHFMSNEDTKTKTHFLSTYFKCDCTDCWGSDSERECNVERVYFAMKNETSSENPYYETYNNDDDENVVEHSML